MSKKVVGVDIGSEAIRAVEVVNAGTARAAVSRYSELMLPEGAVKSGEVVEINTVASVLKQLWSNGGFSTKRVVLGVGNPKVLVRELSVPRLPQKELRESLPFQVQDLLPVPVSDALLDFYPVSESVADSGPVLNGLLVAAVKESVAANVAAVQAAGLNPIAVDLIPFALTRLMMEKDTAGTVALVDVGARTTNVVVMHDGVPQFVRIIPTGGSDLTSLLSQRLEISVEEAERAKRMIGLVSGTVPAEQFAAVEAIHQFAGELLNSLRNTLSFYMSTHPDHRITRIVLSGGGAKLAGFLEAFSEITRLEVLRDDPFANVVNARGIKHLPVESRGGLTVAVGLAMGRAA